MLQSSYLAKVAVAKQHNMFFAYTEIQIKTIRKITKVR